MNKWTCCISMTRKFCGSLFAYEIIWSDDVWAGMMSLQKRRFQSNNVKKERSDWSYLFLNKEENTTRDIWLRVDLPLTNAIIENRTTKIAPPYAKVSAISYIDILSLAFRPDTELFSCYGALLKIWMFTNVLLHFRLLYSLAFDKEFPRRLWRKCLTISVLNSAG